MIKIIIASKRLIRAAIPLGKPALSKIRDGEISNMANNPARQIGLKTLCPMYINMIKTVKHNNGGSSFT